MSIEQLISKDKYFFLQFLKIQRIARIIHQGLHGGVDLNYYDCYCSYENDNVFGWVKEASSFQCAVQVYDEMTSNDGWDIISDYENDGHGELLQSMTPDFMDQQYMILSNEENQ